MKPPADRQLLNIARQHLDGTLVTLESRQSDLLDFHEVSVWGIKAALLEAYQLGFLASKVVEVKGE